MPDAPDDLTAHRLRKAREEHQLRRKERQPEVFDPDEVMVLAVNPEPEPVQPGKVEFISPVPGSPEGTVATVVSRFPLPLHAPLEARQGVAEAHRLLLDAALMFSGSSHRLADRPADKVLAEVEHQELVKCVAEYHRRQQRDEAKKKKKWKAPRPKPEPAPRAEDACSATTSRGTLCRFPATGADGLCDVHR